MRLFSESLVGLVQLPHNRGLDPYVFMHSFLLGLQFFPCLSPFSQAPLHRTLYTLHFPCLCSLNRKAYCPLRQNFTHKWHLPDGGFQLTNGTKSLFFRKKYFFIACAFYIILTITLINLLYRIKI